MNLTDKINQVDPLMASMTAFAIASHVQDTRLEHQLSGAGLFFLVMCQEADLCIKDTLLKLGAVLNDADPYHHRQIAALRQLIKEEHLK